MSQLGVGGGKTIYLWWEQECYHTCEGKKMGKTVSPTLDTVSMDEKKEEGRHRP